MLNAGVSYHHAGTFVENDIAGAILTNLELEDLKELGIASFGLRIQKKIWEEVKKVRGAFLDYERKQRPWPWRSWS